MKNRLLLFFAPIIIGLLFSPLATFAQVVKQAPDPEKFTDGELKKIQKAQHLYDKNKITKAIAILDPIQQTHLLNEQLWSMRVLYEYDSYLTQLYTYKYITYPTGESPEEHFISICRQATLYCKNQEMASVYLRVLVEDEKVDKHVKSDAKDEFDEGEEAFQNGKYEAAEKHYKNAYEEDTNYYKAALYVGDAYFRDKEYEEALPWYKKAVRMHPELLEGHKYLTDVYMKMHKWKDAYEACINGILCYPDVGMFIKMEDICDGLDKKFDRKWMPRFYLPNVVGETQAPIAEAPWSFYRHAKNDGESDFNRKGIKFGKDSVVTCFEVYSWEQMLANDKDKSEELATAREMKENGYLDCYVMVSLFHNSFYKQYPAFAEANANRIRKYFELYLVKAI